MDLEDDALDEALDALTHYRNRASGGTLCGGQDGRLVHAWAAVSCERCLEKRRSKPGPRPAQVEPAQVEPAQEPQPQVEPAQVETQPKPRQPPKRPGAAQPQEPAKAPPVVYPPGFWAVMAESAVDGLDGAAGKLLKVPVADILAGDVEPPVGVPPGRVKRVAANRKAFVQALAAFAEANADKLPGPGVMLVAMGAQYLVGLAGLRAAPAEEEEE